MDRLLIAPSTSPISSALAVPSACAAEPMLTPLAMGFKLTEPEYVSGEQDWIYGIKYRGRSLASGDKVPHEAMLTLCVGNTAIRDSLAIDSTLINMDMNSSADSEAEVDDSWF